MNKNDKQRLKPKQSYNTYLDDLDDFNHCAVKMQEGQAILGFDNINGYDSSRCNSFNVWHDVD